MLNHKAKQYSVSGWYLLLVLFVFQNCAVNKKASVATNDNVNKPTEKVLEKPLSELLLLPYRLKEIRNLNAKANVEINFAGNNQEVKSNIRWLRDSVIWMNFTLYGIEGARLKITRDSFFMIDRIHKKYLSEKLTTLANKYDLPISFENLQALLLGNPILLSTSEITEEKRNAFVHFIQQDSFWRGDYYTSVPQSDLTKIILRQKKNNHVLTHELSDYKKLVGSKYFAYNRKVEFFSSKSGQGKLAIELKDIDISKAKEIKFSIPKSYEKM
jgi:hypothetical protein